MRWSLKMRFPLLELLAVIAMSATRAFMLVPALSKARSKAKDFSCVKLQKQKYLGMHDGNHDQNPPLANIRWQDTVFTRELSDRGAGTRSNFFCAFEHGNPLTSLEPS